MYQTGVPKSHHPTCRRSASNFPVKSPSTLTPARFWQCCTGCPIHRPGAGYSTATRTCRSSCSDAKIGSKFESILPKKLSRTRPTNLVPFHTNNRHLSQDGPSDARPVSSTSEIEHTAFSWAKSIRRTEVHLRLVHSTLTRLGRRALRYRDRRPKNLRYDRVSKTPTPAMVDALEPDHVAMGRVLR